MDSIFEKQLQLRGGGRFTGVSPDIQNDLINCLDNIIEDEILKEKDE